nr:MAG TPA: ATP synthase B chain-like protein [Caudoviricetes sp.]
MGCIPDDLFLTCYFVFGWCNPLIISLLFIST